MASTSSAKTIYDVFLSFRGADTRDNFTSHLRQKLLDNKIETFIDDRIHRGEKIESSLMKVIQESQLSVIVFSKRYATSPWCLDELVKIIECRELTGRTVLPIFYNVDPSHVQHQTGIFGDAFEELEAEHSHSMAKWRKALTEAATLSGWDSQNYRPDSKLVEVVVKDIINKISPASYSICNDLVGIDSHIWQILPLLCIESLDVRVLGLWGMGGIGKTTIAEALVSQMSNQYDGCCILSNVREESSKSGLIHLRKCLFSKILGDDILSIEMSHVLPTSVVNRLRRKKVIVVLDDVSDSEQLEVLAGNRSWFCPGSRVIVTSRDKQVLLNMADSIYEVKGLDDIDAHRLLILKAFKDEHPPENYTNLLARALNYSKGVPLALKVLGSHLCKRSPREWEFVLDKLKQSPDLKIQKILEVSYDELDNEAKNIFLDIACFFKGSRRYWVEDILNGCGFSSSWGIMCLIDKCLLTIGSCNTLDMHDLIQEMGRHIAQREGSRLENSKVICQMLANTKGKESVQGICLDLSKTDKIFLHPKSFSRMPNLRLLKFYRHRQREQKPVFMLESGQSEYLKCLPSMLSLIHWEEYPYKSLPSKSFMENLVELNMPNSNITHLWDGDKCPRNLKKLELFGCRQLMRLPDLSSATRLYKIDLFLCESLGEIDSSIKLLYNLTHLYLHGCKKLKTLPEIPPNIQQFDISNSGVEEWSSSIQFLDNLVYINMYSCINITNLPIKLRLSCVSNEDTSHLNLSGCQNLHKLPEIKGNIKKLDLSMTAIEELPSSIGYSSPSLVSLFMFDCKNLKTLPDSICKLKYLQVLDLRGCSILSKLPPLNGLSSLKDLDLGGCSKLEELPLLYGLDSLEKLSLDRTLLVEIPNDIVSLLSLEKLSLKNCKRLQSLPKLPQQLSQLQLENCTSLGTAEVSYHIVTAVLPSHHWFNYCNCVNLDDDALSNILADAWLILKELSIAFKDARKHFEFFYEACIPGSEIPDWYSYQSQGSLIATKFPPFSFTTLFLGFAFSFVLEICLFQLNSLSSNWLYFRCDCHFKNANGKEHSHYSNCKKRYAVTESEHVFLWYDLNWDSKKNKWLIENGFSVNNASFKFRVFSGWGLNRKELKVKTCGVHLIYEDVQEKWNRSRVTNKKRRIRSNEEEPLPKRMKDDSEDVMESEGTDEDEDEEDADEEELDLESETSYKDEDEDENEDKDAVDEWKKKVRSDELDFDSEFEFGSEFEFDYEFEGIDEDENK
ncbi:disease resistance-like protein DSC1 isoform X2 [Mercurialis annua]|uniref:disease resistance-like protein DSC1 isoform X2 n=1 Tax=Mercurialis annua TaxID=3986 RepID=UPI0024AD4FC0|nr:disease resistance-like protein DSC1 isoform X2 [Mercurialis annua]